MLSYIKNYSSILNNLISIDNVLVRKEIAEVKFACDLKKCKGACCTLESDYGAPLKIEEIEKIETILLDVKPYLPQDHTDIIDKDGFFDTIDGELMTKSMNKKSCVFVYVENEIAKCAIERAFFDGKTDFRKPITCHLFPIRVSNFGGEVLRYEKFKECSSAVENGNKTGEKLIDFCRESLTRLYGNKWYSRFKQLIGSTDVIT